MWGAGTAAGAICIACFKGIVTWDIFMSFLGMQTTTHFMHVCLIDCHSSFNCDGSFKALLLHNTATPRTLIVWTALVRRICACMAYCILGLHNTSYRVHFGRAAGRLDAFLCPLMYLIQKQKFVCMSVICSWALIECACAGGVCMVYHACRSGACTVCQPVFCCFCAILCMRCCVSSPLVLFCMQDIC